LSLYSTQLKFIWMKPFCYLFLSFDPQKYTDSFKKLFSKFSIRIWFFSFVFSIRWGENCKVRAQFVCLKNKFRFVPWLPFGLFTNWHIKWFVILNVLTHFHPQRCIQLYQVSISSTFYVRIFRTNIIFLCTCN